MFLRSFIKKGLLEAIGNLPDYQIILNAMGWYEKGVLLEEDLVEINQAIEDSHREPEIVEEDSIEQSQEDTFTDEIEEPIQEEVIINEEENIEQD